jgi:hypothetical protein
MAIIIDDDPVTITVTLPVSAEFVHDVFVTACEGGINAWCEIDQYHWSDGSRNPDLYGFFAIVRAHDIDDFDVAKFRVDASVIAAGLRRIAAGPVEYLGEGLRATIVQATIAGDAGEIDAGDADTIVQVGLFGKVIYG